MSTTDKCSDQSEPEPSADDLAQIEAAAIAWGDAVRAGAKFSIISLAHDDPRTIPSDALLEMPHGLEVVEVFDAIIAGGEGRDTYHRGIAAEKRRPQRRKLTYVESRLVNLANRYIAVTEYLEKNHSIDVPGDEYSNWKKKLRDQSNSFVEASAQGPVTAAESKIFGPENKTDDPLMNPDLSILAAVAVLETILYIGRIVDMSVREGVAPLSLDSALQLSEAFSFCESSYALLNIEDIKERGWREIQSKYRREAAASVRSAINERLVAMLSNPNKERFRYTGGKRRGRLKVDYIVGRIQSEFESDDTWQKKVPGKTVLREVVRNFDNSK